MNKPLFIFLFSCAAVMVNAQVNLVPNGSFEQYDTCPDNQARIYYAVPWFQPDTCFGGNTRTCSSSDLYNSCATGIAGVPDNQAGHQFARTGVGYAGITFLDSYTDSISGDRECIEVKLTDSLINGISYLVEFYVSLSNTPGWNVMGTDAIQCVLSDSMVYQFGYRAISLTPAISNPPGNIIMDTTNWVRIAGTYHAHGGEKYLVIGNFLPNASCGVDSTGGGTGGYAYYFIDDVAVFPDSSESVQTPSSVNGFVIYPNPASEVVSLQFSSSKNENVNIVISDALGRIISESVHQTSIGMNRIEIPISGLSSGTYFIRTESDHQLIILKFLKE